MFGKKKDLTETQVSNLNDLLEDKFKKSSWSSADFKGDGMIYKKVDIVRASLSDYIKKKIFELERFMGVDNDSFKDELLTIKSNKIIQTYRDKNINKHIISLHDKFAISFACVILFFIGAPLGAIIRKGGFGLPLVLSIVLFCIFHFIGIFTKNLAEDNSINPVLASWLSTIIMLPVSIYLTNRATKDRSIFNFDNLYLLMNKFLKRSDKI